MLKVATIQLCSTDQPEHNWLQASSLLTEAAAAGAQLALLPENFLLMPHSDGQYQQLAAMSERYQQQLADLAAQLELWIVVGSLPVLGGSDGRLLSRCLVINANGEQVTCYDKIHLFDVNIPGRDQSEQYQESAIYAPGTETVVVETPWGGLGLSICYDLRFPELYRQLQAKGARILCVPAAFTARTGLAHWQTLLQARAIENLCYLLAANQVGEHSNGRQTWGHSQIVDPWGTPVVINPERIGISVASLDFQRQDALRQQFPCLNHRVL